MFNKVLIANRGEIACRVMKTAHRLGAKCVAVYSDADKRALHVALADESHRLGPAPASESYLKIDRIIAVAKRSGAEAIHPGYGFLSENPEFVEACDAAGLIFIGPPARTIRTMGLKDAAKRLVEKAGVPIVPGYLGENQKLVFLAMRAEEIGYPILIKARAGGGGLGMRRVDYPSQFAAAFESAQREADASFGDGHVLIEKFVVRSRHIEVQIFADSFGHIVHLFERDCSLQRRHQKVIEEAPAPGMTQDLRQAMGEAAVKCARAAGYLGAGTVEFIVDVSEGLSPERFYFMEMNTRLQVEHPVTEAITGLDLVEWQLRVAAGEPLPRSQDQLSIDGHAIEARIYAEDARRNFLPSTGRLTHLRWPDEVRVDTGVRQGDEIGPFYDPMIAKLIVQGSSRQVALSKLFRALGNCRVVGCSTNIDFLSALVRHPDVIEGNVDTRLIEREFKVLTVETKPTDIATAVAAVAALGLLAESGDPNPWSRLTAWRAWGEAEHFARLAWRGNSIDAHIVSLGPKAFRVTLPAATITCSLISREGNHLILEFGDRIVKAEIAEARREIGVFLDDTMHTFTLPDPLEVDADGGPGSNSIVSPITGIVKIVNVAPRSRVLKGDALIMIEAMKMEHTLTAPRNAEIAEVLVRAGDQVHEGAALLKLADEAG